MPTVFALLMVFTLSLLSLGSLLHKVSSPSHFATTVFPRQSNNESDIQWSTCGQGIQCTNISVPLDYHNASDKRTFNIAVNRLPATDQKNRKGSIFFNSGGPGGPGVSFINITGAAFSAFLNGQYDIIGFDPRGVGLTNPHVSCFDSALQELVSISSLPAISLPASASALNSTSVQEDLERQVAAINASAYSLAKECQRHTGEKLAYVGTEAVVRDIDFISRKINGDKEPIGYWGFSYGTAIGQYLVKILPAERIGHVFFESVLDADKWNDYPTTNLDQGVGDIDELIETFASTCIDAGQNCTLNAAGSFNSSKELLSKLDAAIDELYYHPTPAYGLGMPSVINAKDLRPRLVETMYTPHRWPEFASLLGQVFAGNFSVLGTKINSASLGVLASLPDLNSLAVQAIRCADTKAYDADRPRPTSSELTKLMLEVLNKNSHRIGESWFNYQNCEGWDAAGLAPRKTHYNGTFELPNGTLSIPSLIASNTLDNVTPLKNAKLAAKHLGDNGRMVELRGGLGHTVFSQFSLCMGRIARAYFLNNTIPKDEYTYCSVDEKAWQPVNLAQVEGPEGDVAWAQLTRVVRGYLYGV